MLQYIQLSEPFADWYFPNEQSGQFITSGVPFPVWKVLQHIKSNLIYISWWHLGRIEIFHLDISCSCWASLYLLNKFQLDRKYSLETHTRTGKCQADTEDKHCDLSCQFRFDKFQQHTKYIFDWDQSFPCQFDIEHTLARKISSCFRLHSLHYFDTFLPGRVCRCVHTLHTYKYYTYTSTPCICMNLLACAYSLPLPSYTVFSPPHLCVRVFLSVVRFCLLLFCSEFSLFFSAISVAFPGGHAVCPCSSYMSGACQCTALNSYEAVWLACVVSVGSHPAHNAVGSGPATYPIGAGGTWKARHWIVEVISWGAGLRQKVHFDDIQLVGPILGGYVPIPVKKEVMSGFRLLTRIPGMTTLARIITLLLVQKIEGRKSTSRCALNTLGTKDAAVLNCSLIAA